MKQVVRENVPPKTIDANLKAFELGLRAVQK
jgi:Pyruvate/2-oxoacid:ferredoxin oxidoreductase gamma subunit